jgi:HlyD family secretion protein
VPVTRGSVVETVDATGTVEPVTTVLVGTQVSGTIQSLRADFNSTVRKGQVIARLDPSLFRTQVDQAQATARTGHGAYRTTRAATLPSNTPPRPLWP